MKIHNLDSIRGEALKRKKSGKKLTNLGPPVAQGTVKGRSSTILAREAKVSHGLFKQVERIRREDPELYKKIGSGELAPKRAERILRDREAAKKREAKQLRESGIQKVFPPDIRQGDFREVLKDISDVDLIYTDPPYPKEFLPLWEDLSLWASKVLKPGHLLVAYSGHYHLPEVIQKLSKHLSYLWLGWIQGTGPQASVHQRPIMTGGKPILFFSNGNLTSITKSRRFYDTSISSYSRDLATTGNDTTWTQDQAPAVQYIESLTERGELVVDPFVGSGTFALVSKTLLRKFIGAEIDPRTCEEAIKRTF